MQIIDVTRPLAPGMPAIPGVTQPVFRQRDTGQYRISDVLLSTHGGTHIDAPAHYLEGGAVVDALPLDHLVGPCRVLDLGGVAGAITSEDLEGRLCGARRLLLKTGYAMADPFSPDFAHLDTDAARLLVREGVACVGIDTPSIEAIPCDGAVHRALLGSGCAIIEMLDLAAAAEGEYTLLALPLPLAGLDGSPARVVLCREEE
ncbi:cyclase family protein [Methanoculleus sp. FWC-SCC1]|uniref:Cyclase family protein n=1 Tax=Methanoculleus frigidifontis TaxID=2584085 RepID=A0ABT8MDW2_9EURY|nr:cyclase family protein [Methanoculleus sp. FWC-SCC1]MDN7026045.1 cyclase family protein [Methanoculleus sp. FWC-SCC1]